MTTFPKLRYPIHTKGLNNKERMILLAYDMIWRSREALSGNYPKDDYSHDLDANLMNLGHFIENQLCGGDMALRFEGYDNQSPEDQEAFPISSEVMKQEWQEIVKEELKNK